MPLSTSAAFLDRLHRLYGADPVLWLYEIAIPSDPPTRYRFAANTDAVRFGINPATGDPHLYSPAAIKHEGIEQDREGGHPEIVITVSANAFEMSYELDRYDGLDDAPVEIILVSSLSLNDPSAALRFPGRVVRSRMVAGDEPQVGFVVASHSLYAASLPRNRYSATRCGWEAFGGVGCGYAIPANPTNVVGGGFDSCPRILPACKERGQDEAARGVPVRHPLRMRLFRGTR